MTTPIEFYLMFSRHKPEPECLEQLNSWITTYSDTFPEVNDAEIFDDGSIYLRWSHTYVDCYIYFESNKSKNKYKDANMLKLHLLYVNDRMNHHFIIVDPDYQNINDEMMNAGFILTSIFTEHPELIHKKYGVQRIKQEVRLDTHQGIKDLVMDAFDRYRF